MLLSIFRRRVHVSRSFRAHPFSIRAADPDPQVTRTWVDSPLLPSAVVPYLRLARVDRPAGTLLVLLPAWTGACVASLPGVAPDATLLAALGAGAFFVRGAGCAVNDVWDARFDAAVARTRARPVASGTISRRAALCAAAALFFGGLGALLQLPAAGGAWAIASLPLIVIYPALKRVTYYPQVALGLAMNWGVLVAAAAEHARNGPGVVESLRGALGGFLGAPSRAVLDALDTYARLGGWGRNGGGGSVHTPSLAGLLVAPFSASAAAAAPVALFAGCALWTVVYDTLYAHQDVRDDKRLGLKSTAILIGPGRSRVVLGTLAVGAVGAWTVAGVAAQLSWPWFVSVAGAGAHLAWQLGTARWEDGKNLSARFVSNKYVAVMLFVGALSGRVLT